MQQRAGRRRPCGVSPRRQSKLTAAVLESLEQRRHFAANLVISEFLASNDTGITDTFGNREDWIEIHNAGDASANLNDYFLTDDSGNPEKWRFPVQTIAANEYLLVYASGRDLAVAGSQLHTNFQLAAGGEYLGLIRAIDDSVQFEYAPSFGVQTKDVSYGLQDADNPASTRQFFTTPTPGAANLLSVEAPVFSTPGKVFTASFSLTLSTPTAGATIYYTTNDTIPTTSSTLYTGAITVSANARIRARAFLTGYNPSPIVSNNYMFSDSSTSGFSTNLPIVVLNTFGTTMSTSATTNTLATVAFIDTSPADGRADMLDTPSFNGRAGLRIRGSTSSQSDYPKKQFAVELWDENNADKSASILGMPAESDWVLYAPYSEKALMQNALAMQWANETGHYASRTRYVEVYLNQTSTTTAIDYTGDYLGVYILMEKIKVDSNRVDIAALNPTDTTLPDISGGYLFKKDRKDSDEFAIDTLGGAEVATQKFIVAEPELADLNTQQQSYLQTFFTDLDAVMQGSNFADPVNGYAKYLDVGSWVDYYIVAEMTKNIDAYWLSTYMNMDRNGKLAMGPVWDFNLALGQAGYRNGASPAEWNGPTLGFLNGFGDQYGYYGRLFDDPNFKLKVADRWQELRKTAFSTAQIHADIDANVAILSDNNGNYPSENITVASGIPTYGLPTQTSNNPVVRNFKKWNVLGQYTPGSTYEDPQGRWIEDIKLLKAWMKARVEWMDTQFAPAPVLSPAGGNFGSPTNVGMTPKAQATYTDTTILAAGAAAKAIVPTAAGTPGWGWQNPGFTTTIWQSGTTPVGYDNKAVPTFTPLGLTVASAANYYIRVEFNIANVNAIDHLILRMKYDDGFVAWINGVRMIEGNAPAEKYNPVWNGAASPTRSDASALQYVELDITQAKAALVNGLNVLAIQAINDSVKNDLYIVPELVNRVYSNATAGSIYYTLDGSDPRDSTTNGPSAAAILYSGTVPVSSSTRIRARSLNAGTWSGIADEVYNFDANNLRVTEIMYNPTAGGAFAAQEYEYVEFKNIGATPLNLTGYHIVAGLTGFTFPSTSLAAGAYGVIVKNQAAFEERYGTSFNILGSYGASNLDNGGEMLTIWNGFDQEVQSFTYDDIWYPNTDGAQPGSPTAFSLVLRNPLDPVLLNWNNASAWRSSYLPLGLPGQDDADNVRPTLQSAIYNAAGNTLQITFSEQITLLNPNNATLIESLTSTSFNPTGVSTTGNVALFTLPALADGIYSFSLPGASVNDPAANTMLANAAYAFIYVAGGHTLVLPTLHTTYAVNQLAIGTGATLDLKNDTVTVSNTAAGSWNGSAYAGVNGLVAAGRIISSSTPTPASALQAIGVSDATQPLKLTRTFAGDANVDGKIDGDDYFAIDAHAGQVGGDVSFANGDFNYDGRVNADDYFLIDANYNKAASPMALSAAPAIPAAAPDIPGVFATATIPSAYDQLTEEDDLLEL